MVVAMKHDLESLCYYIFGDRLTFCHGIIFAETDENLVVTNPLFKEICGADGKRNDRGFKPPVFEHFYQTSGAIA